MNLLNKPLDSCRAIVRHGAHGLAKLLNTISGGKLSPDAITYTSLLGHVLIAFELGTRHFVWAAGLLVIFGLMDTLDGELARLQNRASPAGMLLDASTDRMKETLLYIGAAYALIQLGNPGFAVWAVAVCGGSLVVSYVKAKGETAVISSGATHSTVNRLFQDGLMRYEVRMFVLVVGLLAGHLGWTLVVLAVLSWLTAFSRLIRISRYLNHAKS